MNPVVPLILTVPSQKDLDDAVRRFQDEWGMVDQVLYRLCQDFPGHDSESAVTAKVALVERAYAAGLERQIEFDEGEQPIVVAGKFVAKHRAEVDDVIAALPVANELLDARSMAVIVEQHGRLTQLLREATRKKALSPRSFASKYLHFHRPVVPIYDEYARQKLTHLVHWDSAHIPFPLPPHGDQDYWDYCVRLLRLYDACRQAGTSATVKELDAFLWAVPVSGGRNAAGAATTA
jgi:hypothetical protein